MKDLLKFPLIWWNVYQQITSPSTATAKHTDRQRVSDRQIIGRMNDGGRWKTFSIICESARRRRKAFSFELFYWAPAERKHAGSTKKSSRLFQLCAEVFIELIANAIKINKGRLYWLYRCPLFVHHLLGGFIRFFSLPFRPNRRKLLFLFFNFVRAKVSHDRECDDDSLWK